MRTSHLRRFLATALGVAAVLAAALADAAISIKWGRPTQAEREAKVIEALPGANGHHTEILVYIDGMEPGREYEIEVEVKEKAPEKGGDDQKEALEVEELISTPVPWLPPPDPR